MENFNIHITFENGSPIIEQHTESTIGSAISRFIRGPAAIMGLIAEVKVIDSLDCICFHWTKVAGILFPTRAQIQAAQE